MNCRSQLALITCASALLQTAPSILANPTNFTVQAITQKNAFQLTDANGSYVTLHFLLKTECPFCIRHTQEYLQEAASVPGVVHIFLKPDSEDEIEAWEGKLRAEDLTKFPIYRDPDAKLAEAYGVPGGYRFHGQDVHYPALVLLDPKGKEVFRYVGKSNTDRYSFAKFTAKLAELRSSNSADR